MSAELVTEETEEVPELLVTDEFVLLDGFETVLFVDELFEFDVEGSERSCSTPLLAQPVMVHAKSAQTAADMISFFIFHSLSYTNFRCAFATLIFYTNYVKNTIEKSEN